MSDAAAQSHYAVAKSCRPLRKGPILVSLVRIGCFGPMDLLVNLYSPRMAALEERDGKIEATIALRSRRNCTSSKLGCGRTSASTGSAK